MFIGADIYLPLQAMITLLKPTNTPLFGLLEKGNASTFVLESCSNLTTGINVDPDTHHHVYSLEPVEVEKLAK